MRHGMRSTLAKTRASSGTGAAGPKTQNAAQTPRAKIAVFISGAGTNLAALYYASLDPQAAYEIVLVAANDPDARGLAFAKGEGIGTFALAHKGMSRADHDAAMEEAALKAGAKFIVLAGYMRILSPDFTRRWQGRMFNIHPSLLPKYPGLNTHARAIEAGDKCAGASVHLVTEQLDAGEILRQIEVAVLPEDTPDTLARRVLIAEHQLYPRAINAYLRRANDPAHLFERLNTLALSLPQTHMRESHGSPGWRVGTEKSGKYFAHFSDRHHGQPHIALLVKTGSMDELEHLVESASEAYFKPAYYGASGWAGIILNREGVDWDEVKDWMERSWRRNAPKSLTKLLDVADEF